MTYGDKNLTRLYSVNLMLDDPVMIYEWNWLDAPGSITRVGNKLYGCAAVSSSYEYVELALFSIDPEKKTYEKVFDDLTFNSGNVIGDSLYYTPKNGSLWVRSLTDDNSTDKCLLSEDLLNREDGDIRFIATGLSGTRLEVMRQSPMYMKTHYYDLSKGVLCDTDLEEDMFMYLWAGPVQYIMCLHNTPAYENDKHYQYYQDYQNNGYNPNSSGGEIWYRTDSSGELKLMVRMMTDNIPDAINNIVATDGKTMVVTYRTYKDFSNIYNDYQIMWEENVLRYAVIDLETGIVYKNDEVFD